MTISAAQSQDPDGLIANYTWNFGDGSSPGTGEVTHTYGNAGQYNLTLEVTDDKGVTANTTEVLTVSTGGGPLENILIPLIAGGAIAGGIAAAIIIKRSRNKKDDSYVP